MGKKYSDELYHYRTVGSKNGFSKDPNYKPVGAPAGSNITSLKDKNRAVNRYKNKYKGVSARDALMGNDAHGTDRSAKKRIDAGLRKSSSRIIRDYDTGKFNSRIGKTYEKKGSYGKAAKNYAVATYNAAKSGNLKSAIGYAGKSASNYAKKGYGVVKNTYLALKKKGVNAINSAKMKIKAAKAKRKAKVSSVSLNTRPSVNKNITNRR